MQPKKNSTLLISIGYQGRTLETHLTLLAGAGVTVLCDVRRNAVSRIYGFSKSTLANGCGSAGIRYEHLPGLGISADRRRGLKTNADYLRLMKEYESVDLPQRHEELATIQGWVFSSETVALMCFERDPDNCHRSRVASEIVRRLGSDYQVEHL